MLIPSAIHLPRPIMVQGRALALPIEPLKPRVTLEQSAVRSNSETLAFSYDGKKVLDRVTLKIEAGQTVALVGPTGSGKSTLINLLPRLADPPRGSVFVDGHDVRDLPLAVLRSSIGFVPQEPFLFSDTLANNVAFGLTPLWTGRPRVGPQRQ